MRRWTVRLLILVVVVALLYFLLPRLFAADPIEVDVLAVERGTVEETVTNSRAGTVKSRRRAKLSPEIGGRVVALPFREGDSVKRGELVLAIDAEELTARLTLAQRDLEAARAEEERACLAAERAARELARTRNLAADGIVSTDLLDQIEAGADTAAASCRAARAGVARAAAATRVAEAALAKTRLTAPFDAVVAEVSVEVGEWTTPSPPALPVPPVIDLIDPTSIFISAPMDEVDSARIRQGQPARVTVDSYRDRSFAGQVVRVAPYVLDIEQQNRTVEIEVELEDPDLAARLLPGTSADVEVILESRGDALRVPTSVLLERDRVLVIEDGVLAERPVELGLRNWNYAEVLSGLDEGDEVVTSLDRPEVEAGVEAVASDEPRQ